MNARLTIQIVGWNSAPHLQDACEGLQGIPENEAIVRYIDNNSEDTSVEIVKKHLPNAQIIELQDNLGFVGAHNIGFAECTTEFILVHDPDVRVQWEPIRTLLDAFTDSAIAAVQGKLMRKDQENIIDSTGINQTLTLNGYERGAGEDDTGQYDIQADLLATTGACSLYRVAALKKVAHGSYEIAKHQALEVFDREFFAYKEDVDLGWRLNNAGYKVQYIPIPVGTHARTLGHRGKVRWYFKPAAIYSRLKSLRTRYSTRNYIWMLMKNMTWRDELKHDWFVLPRILLLGFGSMLYPPLFTVWGEVIKKAPLMLKKRKRNSFKKTGS